MDVLSKERLAELRRMLSPQVPVADILLDDEAPDDLIDALDRLIELEHCETL